MNPKLRAFLPWRTTITRSRMRSRALYVPHKHRSDTTGGGPVVAETLLRSPSVRGRRIHRQLKQAGKRHYLSRARVQTPSTKVQCFRGQEIARESKLPSGITQRRVLCFARALNTHLRDSKRQRIPTLFFPAEHDSVRRRSSSWVISPPRDSNFSLADVSDVFDFPVRLGIRNR